MYFSLLPKASVALISLLVISSLSLLLVLAMSEAQLSTAYHQFDHQANRFMDYVAESCLEEALIRIETSATFTNTTLNFDSDTVCLVTATIGTPWVISIQVDYLNYRQDYRAEISLTTSGQSRNVNLSKWQEI